MPQERAKINKILEIDMDTERQGGSSQIIVRQVASVGYNRDRQPDPEQDIRDDIIILANALAAAVLLAEANGVCKKGEAMQKATNMLSEAYVDATVELSKSVMDEQGNSILTMKQ